MTALTAMLGDITTLAVDAIVNAAKSSLRGGGGVDGAIHAAGGSPIVRECIAYTDRFGPLRTGMAVATVAGALPASHVIHTVGPVWEGHDPSDADALLASCYRESLDVAAGLGARTVAFPAISTGVFGFPKERAARLAVATVQGWVESSPETFDEVIFVCFATDDLSHYTRLLR